jgi:hypothetical protein
MSGWFAFDLDSTIAQYTEYHGPEEIGEPLSPDNPNSAFSTLMRYLAEGKDVRIFTARANDKDAIKPIQNWCRKYFGKVLPITNEKDHEVIEIWDDRAVQVDPKTGIPVVKHKEKKPQALPSMQAQKPEQKTRSMP